MQSFMSLYQSAHQNLKYGLCPWTKRTNTKARGGRCPILNEEIKFNINRCIFCQTVNYEKFQAYNTQSAVVSLEKCHLRCRIQDMIVILTSGDLIASGT